MLSSFFKKFKNLSSEDSLIQAVEKHLKKSHENNDELLQGLKIIGGLKYPQRKDREIKLADMCYLIYKVLITPELKMNNSSLYREVEKQLRKLNYTFQDKTIMIALIGSGNARPAQNEEDPTLDPLKTYLKDYKPTHQEAKDILDKLLQQHSFTENTMPG